MGEVCGFAGGEQGACYARLCWHRGRGVWPSWASGAWCMVLTIVATVLSPLVRTVHLYVGRSVVLERLEACRTRVLSVLIGLVVRAVAVAHEVFRLGDDIGGGYSEQGRVGRGIAQSATA